MAGEQTSHVGTSTAGEREPLLGGAAAPTTSKKPFYRARPLWLVPFAITAALVRGMTMAPRVEVFTQLACASIHHHTFNHSVNPHNLSLAIDTRILSLYSTLDPLGPHIPEHLTAFLPQRSVDTIFIAASAPTLSESAAEDSDSDDGGTEDDPRKLPSPQCVSDPAVQAGAARIQTTLTTTMGLLSALTTGWWGHFSERYGRTRVLAMSTLGLFLTDLTFILVATPGSALAAHGHKLLVIAPIIEGLLGGWSTLQSATSAYVSDCTSPGSRATIFSRFNGVFFLGFSVGPIIGGWIIRNGIPGIDRIGTFNKQGKSVTEVFWLAICLSFVNFFLTTFLFPESLSKEQREKAKLAHSDHLKGKDMSDGTGVDARGSADVEGASAPRKGSADGVVKRFFSPLALFLPVVINETTPAGIRKRKDWSLTFLALTMFLYMLSTGVFQIKYLYAVHTYNWTADKLSYYISYLGGLRALGLLFLLPTIISTFKPKPALPATADPEQIKRAKSSKGHLANEINFDLLLTRCSLFIDILSQFFVVVFPAPAVVHHMLLRPLESNASPSSTGTGRASWVDDPTMRSTVLFVFASGLSSIGSGFIPACQSLALCIVQARQSLERYADSETETTTEGGAGDGEAEGGLNADGKVKGDSGIGKLFGALSMLQALGQMIFGPLLFGLVYGTTVAHFPKAIFVTAGGILTAAVVCACMVRSPVSREPALRKGKARRRIEHERGRSRASKDLRFGVLPEVSPIAPSPVA